MAFNIRSMVIKTSGRIQPRSVVPTDPYFSSVTLLLQADTTNTGTVVDSSTSSLSITMGGTGVQGAVSPFADSGGSLFTGTAAGTGAGTGYVSTANATIFNFGTSDFTVELWAKFSNVTTDQLVFDSRPTSGTAFNPTMYLAGATGKLQWFTNNSSAIVASTACVVNTWNHIAVVKNGATTTMYLNGVSVGSFSDSNTYVSSSPVCIGGQTNTTLGLNATNGYISNFRVVKGTAVYTAAFTPGTAPLTAITNTSLLLKFENAKFLDGSRKNMIVPVGSVAISTSVFKYGTGAIHEPNTVTDYLDFFKTAGSNFIFTGDFTIEHWVYISTGNEDRLFIISDGTTYLGVTATTTTFNAYVQAGSATITSATVVTNTWQHVALVRVGSTVTLYVGGTSRGTTTNSGTMGYTNPTVGTLGFGGSTGLRYFDEVRVTKGVARYTANFTPPTEAFLSA